MSMDYINSLKAIGSPIAYYPMIAKAIGSCNAGLFVSQMMYWEGKQSDKDGWIRKPFKEVENELGLTRYELDTIRIKLKALKIMDEEKRGVPCKIHYKFNWEKMNEVIDNYINGNAKEYVEKQPTLLYKFKEIFDKYYAVYFPLLTTYEWKAKDWKYLKELSVVFKSRTIQRNKDIDENDTEKIEEQMLIAWDTFLNLMPQFYREKQFHPSAISTNFSAIAQLIQTENGKKSNQPEQRKSFSDVAQGK